MSIGMAVWTMFPYQYLTLNTQRLSSFQHVTWDPDVTRAPACQYKTKSNPNFLSAKVSIIPATVWKKACEGSHTSAAPGNPWPCTALLQRPEDHLCLWQYTYTVKNCGKYNMYVQASTFPIPSALMFSVPELTGSSLVRGGLLRATGHNDLVSPWWEHHVHPHGDEALVTYDQGFVQS